MVNAPPLMFTTGPFRVMMAPRPLEIVIPVSLIMIMAPEPVLSVIPIAGESLTMIPFCSS